MEEMSMEFFHIPEGVVLMSATPIPTACVCMPGDQMNHMLRPNVRPPLLDAIVDVDQARRDTLQYVEAFLANGAQVELLGLPQRDAPDAVFENELAGLAARWPSRLQLHRLETLWRFGRTEPHSADFVFMEDLGRFRRMPDGRACFVNSHMTANTRIGEHGFMIDALQTLNALCCDELVHVMELDPDARVEAGDVLDLAPEGVPLSLIGSSERTNPRGIEVWRTLSRERTFGEVYPITVFPGVGLHLTTASGMLDYRTVLLDPTLIKRSDVEAVRGLKLLEVAPGDRGYQNACNCVRFPNGVIGMDGRFPRTMDIVSAAGFTVLPLANSQHAIGAGGLTCRSLRRNWYPLWGYQQ